MRVSLSNHGDRLRGCAVWLILVRTVSSKWRAVTVGERSAAVSSSHSAKVASVVRHGIITKVARTVVNVKNAPHSGGKNAVIDLAW